MLDIVGIILKELKHKTFRYDGSMSELRRETELEKFKAVGQDNPAPLLMSPRAGGWGLDVFDASVMVLIKLWWNASWEAQALGRAHRIGQTREGKAVWACC